MRESNSLALPFLQQQLQFVAPGTVHAFPIVVASKLVENQDSKARSWGVNQPANLVPRPNSEQQAVDQRPKRQLPLFQKTFDLFWLPKWDIGVTTIIDPLLNPASTAALSATLLCVLYTT
ncbi:hypothetical protein MUK42_10425 [Musa troglodytarum]|uniref:Uncharacterized protein n=1 Tax=Musa troglodytarum TaxID=320322 RepID=A0A9E7GIF2_9LILI|nr:hypothetical protein MUK42_10425 [Musa troglodytarum]